MPRFPGEDERTAVLKGRVRERAVSRGHDTHGPQRRTIFDGLLFCHHVSRRHSCRAEMDMGGRFKFGANPRSHKEYRLQTTYSSSAT